MNSKADPSWLLEAANYEPPTDRAPRDQEETTKIYVSFGGDLAKQKDWEYQQMVLASEAMHQHVLDTDEEISDWNEWWMKFATHSRDFPKFAFECIINYGILTREAAQDLAQNAWCLCEFSERNLGRDGWLAIFEEVGYLTDNDLYVQPGNYTLYRGSLHDQRLGMAWSDDPRIARFFARRVTYEDQIGAVYTASIPQQMVLARFDARNESEWVIDTTELDPEEVSIYEVMESSNDS